MFSHLTEDLNKLLEYTAARKSNISPSTVVVLVDIYLLLYQLNRPRFPSPKRKKFDKIASELRENIDELTPLLNSARTP